MNDSTTQSQKRSWWQRLTGGLKRSSSALGGAIADLVTKRKLDAATHCGDRGRADPRRSRPRDRRSHRRGVAATAATTAAISADEVKAVVAGEIEKVLGAGRAAARHRCRAEAVRHPGRRRQRFRQDHHHRQARGQIPRRGPDGHAGRGRHVSRRRHRSAQNLGRRAPAPTSSRAKPAPMPPAWRSMRSSRRSSAAATCCCRYRRPLAKPHRTDERAGKGGARDQEGRTVGAACRAAGARRHRRPERAVAGRNFSEDRRASPAW